MTGQNLKVLTDQTEIEEIISFNLIDNHSSNSMGEIHLD